MSIMQPARSHHSHRRFYLFLTTVVIGAILLLMFINDNGEFNFLTGSLTGSSVGVDGDTEEFLKEVSGSEEIEVLLNFDVMPEVKEETKLSLLRVTFDDLSTKIKINKEELELKNLKNVEMEIRNFEGELEFNEMILSLSGEGKEITVNGIKISTEGSMEISLRDLIYESLNLEGIKLSMVVFEEGSGNLAMGEKLNYVLKDEEVELKGFKGDLSAGTGNESLVNMEGLVNGVSVKGEFDLMLG